MNSLVGVGFFWVGAGSFEKVSGSRRRWEHTCSHQISIMLLEPKNSQKNPTFIGTFSATKKIWFDFLWWRNLGPLPTEKCLQQQGQNHPLRIFKEIGKLRSSPPTVISKSKKSISSNFPCSLYFQIASPLNLPAHRGKKRKMRSSFGEGTSAVLCEPIGIGVKSWSLFAVSPDSQGWTLLYVKSLQKNIHHQNRKHGRNFWSFSKSMSLFSAQWKLKKFHLIKEYLKTTRGNVVPSGFGPRITTSKARSFGLKVSTPVYTKNWHELSRIFINIVATPTAVSSFFLVAFFSRLCQTCVSRYLGCSLSPHVTSKVTMQISPRRPDRWTDRKHGLSTIRLVDSVPILS